MSETLNLVKIEMKLVIFEMEIAKTYKEIYE